jgi:hypothetical protein
MVTGASAGIGAALARELVHRGHGVTLVARREDRLHELAAELGGLARVEVLACDLTEAKARARLLDQMADLGLTVDILVNNAGLGTVGPISGADPDTELTQIRVNVEALTDLCTRATREMVARRRGAILNVGSTTGFHPFPGQVCYAATKAYVLSYGQGLRGELAGTGVTVTTLCPGPVRTEFLRTAGVDEALADRAIPGPFWKSPEDVARAGINALASGRAIVVPGPANALVARLGQHLPARLVVSALRHRHPALR